MAPFTDARPGSGIDFPIHASRGDQTTILDTIGSGEAVLDFDRDGKPDLVLLGPDRVDAYRNEGGFRFQRVDLGLEPKGHWGGAAVADVDHNGWPDLFLHGYGGSALYLNRHGRFQRLADGAPKPPAGKHPAWGTSAGFADLDGDGWADLVACYYLEFGPGEPQRCSTSLPGISSACPPRVYAPQHARVYRNVPAPGGGRRFVDVTESWGLLGHGSSLGVAFQDVEGDGRTDLYLANDERPADFYRNLGGGRFREEGVLSGTAYDRQGRAYAGMGVDWGDLDGDARPDLAATAFYGEEKPLYLNQGGAFFQEAASTWGLSTIDLPDVAFGVRFLDWDNDGRLDLVTANGHIQENAARIRDESRYAQPVRLYRNAGSRFEPLPEGGWPAIVGRALATADFDGDGGMDGVVSNLEGQPLLLRNVARRGHWLGLRLRDPAGDSLALGAVVTVRAGGRSQRFEVHTAGSYMASSDPGVLAGLGDTQQVESVTVRWPGGKTERWSVPGVDRWLELVRGDSQPHAHGPSPEGGR